MANVDNQIGGDGQTTTWLTSAITGYGTESSGAPDLQGKESAAVEAQKATDFKNVLSGSLTQCRPSTGSNASSEGGSKVAQVNVGSHQW